MTFPGVILRAPHTRTRYTGDPDALPYHGWFTHAPRVYLADTPVLDVLGRHNGMTHTWLRYECANVGCRYVLLVRAEEAHALAWRSIHRPGLANSPIARDFIQRMTSLGDAFAGDTVKVALYTSPAGAPHD